MNRTELISEMARRTGLSKSEAKKALDAFIGTVTDALGSGDKIILTGFGTFTVAERAERAGINPSTRKPMVIPAKKVVKFKPGMLLSLAVE